ncbi:MAG: Ig-like domain-containing protein [Treponema sp.]|jgi:hypothetical protein|nr:Ig-like domain-containing protein [Treponema sp.]
MKKRFFFTVLALTLVIASCDSPMGAGSSGEPVVPKSPVVPGDTDEIEFNFTSNRFTVKSYSGSDWDRIKYSFSYNGRYFYYIYLGQMANIPMFSFANQRHNAYESTYAVTISEELRKSTTKAVTDSSQATTGQATERTVSITDGVKVGAEISAKFDSLFVSTEYKLSAEYSWEHYVGNTLKNSKEYTTSLAKTIEEASSYARTTMESRTFPLVSGYPEGYYRYTMFGVSDVYLYIIRDPAQKDKIYYEFREHVVPGQYAWDLEYSKTLPFTKTDASSFKFDTSFLKYLPTPSRVYGEGDWPIDTQGITLNKSATTINKNDTETFIAAVIPYNASNPGVSWNSSNTGVATVSDKGVVTAKAAGTANITATSLAGGYQAACIVTVNVPVTSVTLNKSTTTITEEDTEDTLTATVYPSDASNIKLLWSSSNNGVARVSDQGVITADKAGTATITAASQDDSSKIATCTVTVIPKIDEKQWVTVRSGQVKIISGSGIKDQVSFAEWGIDIADEKAKGYKTISFYFRMEVKENDSTTEYLYLYNSAGSLVAGLSFEHTAGKKDGNWWMHYENELKFENLPIDYFPPSYFVVRYNSNSGIFHDWLNRNLQIRVVLKP